jgi:hypothetical protein
MILPRLAVAGDLTLTDAVLDGIEREGASRWFGQFAHELLGDTLGLVCNLEAVVAERGEPRPNKPLLRSNPSVLEALQILRVVAVTVANNHVLDWGWAAARGTAAALDRLRIASTGLLGSGPGVVPIRLDLGGWTVGLLAYADATSGAVFTLDGRPCVPAFDPDRAAEEVAGLAREVDAVLVSIHAGVQNVPYPEPHLLRAFRATARAGAALVFGHHAHCLRGLETPQGHWIAHGLGNFISPDHVVLQDGHRIFIPRLKENRVGAVLIIEPGGRGRVILCNVRFVRTNGSGQPTVLRGRAASRWRRKMESLSEALTRPDYDRFQPDTAARITRSRVWRFGLARALASGPSWSQLRTAWRFLRER